MCQIYYNPDGKFLKMSNLLCVVDAGGVPPKFPSTVHCSIAARGPTAPLLFLKSPLALRAHFAACVAG